METISACPHHGFDTWMLVNHFYGGMSPAMKQLLKTMCGGDFLSKHPKPAMEAKTPCIYSLKSTAAVWLHFNTTTDASTFFSC